MHLRAGLLLSRWRAGRAGLRVPASMRVCSTPGCPELHQGTGRCPACAATADRARRPHGNPYATRGHRLGFRAPVLAAQPYCRCVGECGHHEGMCGQPSTVADHHPVERGDLVAQKLDPNDPRYGRGICKPCHDAKTARTSPGGWNAR